MKSPARAARSGLVTAGVVGAVAAARRDPGTGRIGTACAAGSAGGRGTSVSGHDGLG